LKLFFDSIYHPGQPQGDSGEKHFSLKGRNLQQNLNQEGRPSALTFLWLRGQRRGVNKHHNTRPEIPAVKETHKLMTNLCNMYMEREERCIMGGPPAVYAFSTTTKGCCWIKNLSNMRSLKYVEVWPLRVLQPEGV